MHIVRALRAVALRRLVQDQQDFYQCAWTPARIREWQLDQFNAQWESIRREVPYFRRQCERGNLPNRFSSWGEFKETVPIMDKRTVQTERAVLTSVARPPDFWRTTGGSTAEPVQLPAWNSEREFPTKDLWYARSWFGVRPADRLFLIWGHSHLLGSGVSNWLNTRKQRLKDAVLGYHRYSAYDLSERGLREAAEALLECKPNYVVAYAVALDRFARLNRHYREAFHGLGLKVAIATAEAFPWSDSADIVADVLGCPVAMEYGAIETGLIAHQRPHGWYQVFWRHSFLEGRESEHLPGAYEIFVTSLFPRCFPLVRYRVGDLISANPDAVEFDQEFESVTGRCNDLLTLTDGGMVHSEAFSHAVKEISSIAGYQVVQSAEGEITLNYLASAPLRSAEVATIRQRLGKIHPDLAGVRIARVSALEQTLAGKTRRICRR